MVMAARSTIPLDPDPWFETPPPPPVETGGTPAATVRSSVTASELFTRFGCDRHLVTLKEHEVLHHVVQLRTRVDIRPCHRQALEAIAADIFEGTPLPQCALWTYMLQELPREGDLIRGFHDFFALNQVCRRCWFREQLNKHARTALLSWQRRMRHVTARNLMHIDFRNSQLLCIDVDELNPERDWWLRLLRSRRLYMENLKEELEERPAHAHGMWCQDRVHVPDGEMDGGWNYLKFMEKMRSSGHSWYNFAADRSQPWHPTGGVHYPDALRGDPRTLRWPCWNRAFDAWRSWADPGPWNQRRPL